MRASRSPRMAAAYNSPEFKAYAAKPLRRLQYPEGWQQKG